MIQLKNYATLSDLTSKWKILKAQMGTVLPNGNQIKIDVNRYSRDEYDSQQTYGPSTKMVQHTYHTNDDPLNDIIVSDIPAYGSSYGNYRTINYQGKKYYQLLDPNKPSDYTYSQKFGEQMPQELRNYLSAMNNQIKGFFPSISPINNDLSNWKNNILSENVKLKTK